MEEEPISQGQKALKAGDKARARRLLAQALKLNPRNDAAWVILSTVVEEPERVIDCLERALAINPENQIAQRKLKEWLYPSIELPDQEPIQEAEMVSEESQPFLSQPDVEKIEEEEDELPIWEHRSEGRDLPSPPKKRPAKLIIIALVALINGLLGFVSSLYLISLSEFLPKLFKTLNSFLDIKTPFDVFLGIAASRLAAWGNLAPIGGLVVAGISLLNLIFAFGLLFLGRWAWQLGRFIQWATILLVAISALFGFLDPGVALRIFAVAAIMLFMLSTREVVQAVEHD